MSVWQYGTMSVWQYGAWGETNDGPKYGSTPDRAGLGSSWGNMEVDFKISLKGNCSSQTEQEFSAIFQSDYRSGGGLRVRGEYCL